MPHLQPPFLRWKPHNWSLLLPVFVASVAGMAITVLWIPRSILTEKVARRGVHVAREYSVNPLGSQSVAQIMVPRERVVTVPGEQTLGELARPIESWPSDLNHSHYLVIEAGSERIVGSVPESSILIHKDVEPAILVDALARPLLTIGQWERVRSAVEKMAQHNQPELLVVDKNGQWVGFMVQTDTFKTWKKAIAAEKDRQRIFRWPQFGGDN